MKQVTVYPAPSFHIPPIHAVSLRMWQPNNCGKKRLNEEREREPVRKREMERATRLITVHLISLTPLNLCLSPSLGVGEMLPEETLHWQNSNRPLEITQAE